MTSLGLIAAFATLLLAGGGIAAVLLSRSKSFNLFEIACLAWPLGVASVSFALWLLGNISSGVTLQASVTAMSVAAGVVGWMAFRRAGARLTMPRPGHWLEWILLVVVTAQVVSLFFASAKHTLGWDGLLVWEIKARFAFLNHGVLPASYFSEDGRAFSHPEYPLAIPFTQLWIYLWIGEANQFWAKMIFPAFYAAGAALLGLLGSRLTSRRWIGYVLAAGLYFVPQVSVMTGSVLVGYADFPLAVFYLAAVGYLLSSLTSESGSAFAVFATCLACLPWVKKEGSILWAAATFAGVVVILLRHKSPRLLLALLPGALLMLVWRLFLWGVHAAPTVDFVPLTPSALRSNLSRLPSIYHAVLAESMTMSNWGIFWLIAVMAVLLLLWRWRDLSCSLLVGCAFLPILLYSFIYIFSAWHQYLDHVYTSIPRLLMQVVPVTWLAIGMALAAGTSRRPRVDVLPPQPMEGSRVSH